MRLRTTQGFLYVATGERFRTEALASIASLRRSNPGALVTVYTDGPDDFADARLDRVVRVESPRYSFVDKLAGFLDAPYDRNVFLDTDTYVATDITDLFDLLGRVDVAAAHAWGRSGARFHAYEDPSLPAAFTQFNTGVVAFRRTPEVLAAFARWREIYVASPQHRHDQPAFRQAMFESKLTIYALPPEYNFLVGHAYLAGPVRLFHSRAFGPNPEAFVKTINERTSGRVFVPPDKLFVLPPS